MFDFANKWKPIFSMLEQYDGFLLPGVIDDELVSSLFDFAREYIKTCVLYIWQKEKNQRVVNDFSIGTWSWHVQKSSIEKWGTPANKALLPALTAWSKGKSWQTFVIPGDSWVHGRIRMNKLPQKMFARQAVGEEVAAAFEDAFGGAE